MADDFEAGREIVRDLAQRTRLPDVLRLSDEEETRVSLAWPGPRGCRSARSTPTCRLRRRRAAA